MNDIVIFESDKGVIQVQLEQETVWLNQKHMGGLFDKNVRTISEHINNVFKEGELDKEAVIRNFRITAEDGKSYQTNHYNLDVIISVGYRVKSELNGSEPINRKHLVRGSNWPEEACLRHLK